MRAGAVAARGIHRTREAMRNVVVVRGAEIDARRRAFLARRSFGSLAALFLSVGFLMAGVGLQGTLLGVRATMEGFGNGETGLIMSAYYGGFLVGSLWAPRAIATVGHIRVFAALASLASASVLLHAIWIDPSAWVLIRFTSGLAIAGVFVVTESWLNGESHNAQRGRLLASYMTVVLVALAAGQFLLNTSSPAGFALFILASILVSLAVVPTALSRHPGPVIVSAAPVRLAELWHVAPLGPLGAVLSGAGLGVILGLGPVYGKLEGYSTGQISLFMAAGIIGAIVVQFPLGSVSDRLDRRMVMAAVALAAAAAALGAASVSDGGRVGVVTVLMGVVGALTIPLYSLAVAHLNDWLDQEKIISAGGRMILLQGAGAAVGPLVAGVLMGAVGPGAFFGLLVLCNGVVGLFALWRVTRRGAADEDERASYTPVTVVATPQAAATLEDDAGFEERLFGEDAGSPPWSGP